MLLTGLLSGCNGGAVQPMVPADAEAASRQGAEAGATSVQAGAGSAAAGRGSAAESAAAAPATGAAVGLGSQIDQLNGRLTLLQEQVIQLKGISQQQAELGQATLARLQLLTEARELGESSTAAPSLDGAGDQLDMAIAQLMQTLNTLEGGADVASFDVTTAYTSKGWILLRYRTDSGESWIADGGRWTALQEEAGLPGSRYRIEILRADQDIKGYVAVRIDQQTGESWWLNDRRWQVYQ